MKHPLFAIAAAISVALSASAAHAQLPAYSFEVIAPGGGPPGPDGFFGLGAAVTQDTIGATHLLNSMKYDVGVGGFVGARTEIVHPTLNNPPGVNHVLFDVNIPTAYTGTFADIGVTVFGHDIPGGSFGNQVQFADTVSLAALGAGQHLNQRIDLDVSQGPYRFGESFNSIFGSDPTDLTVASAFQFYISKNGANPITV
jgi:hypothetical protein